MTNEIQIFENEDFSVRTILNEDGSISINAEDTAIGFGWTQIKNGKLYIKWERMNNYLSEFGFSPQVGKDDYIPESLFYRLGMKASNETANKYQNWLSTKVIPSIRKTGSYSIKQKTDSYMIEDPIERAKRWIEEEKIRRALLLENQTMKPKVDYYDDVMHSDSVVPIKTIAKDFGMSSQKLNNILKENHIQYKQGKRWYLYNKYADEGYAKSQTCLLPNGETATHTYWTNKGVKFIRDLLGNIGIKVKSE